MSYWTKAIALEADGQLDEAIEVLRTEMGANAPNWEAQVSSLFERRAERLWKEKKKAEAAEAAQQAIEWFWRYAGGASSGSEGLMLSYQARQTERRMERYGGVAHRGSGQ